MGVFTHERSLHPQGLRGLLDEAPPTLCGHWGGWGTHEGQGVQPTPPALCGGWTQGSGSLLGPQILALSLEGEPSSPR